MKYTVVLIFVSVLVIFSCKEESSEQMTTQGYKYNVYSKGDGKTGDVGDYVIFNMDIIDNHGTLIQSYRNRPSLPSVQILEPGTKNYDSNPLMGLLSLVSVGDSLGLIIPTDSIPSSTPQYDTLEHIEYVINVENIQTKEEYLEGLEKIKEEQRIAAEASKAREPEVAEFVQATLKDYNDGAFEDKIVTTESGLSYIIHEEGEGKLPELGKMVSVHYYGVLPSNGNMFDNSFKRGQPYTFPLGQGQVIQAWDQGVQLLKQGTKATLIAPPNLAYGEQGSPPTIPANSSLMFYVEIAEAF